MSGIRLPMVRKEGWLEKSGKLNHSNWKVRYFILSENFLYRYDKTPSNPKNHKGKINVQGANIYEKQNVRPFCFGVYDIFTQKETLFTASNHEQMEEWIYYLKIAGGYSNIPMPNHLRSKQNRGVKVAQPNNLPPGWEMRLDTRTGRNYFVNHNTRESTFNDPRIRIPSSQHLNKSSNLNSSGSHLLSNNTSNPSYGRPQQHRLHHSNSIPQAQTYPQYNPALNQQYPYPQPQSLSQPRLSYPYPPQSQSPYTPSYQYPQPQFSQIQPPSQSPLYPSPSPSNQLSQPQYPSLAQSNSGALQQSGNSIMFNSTENVRTLNFASSLTSSEEEMELIQQRIAEQKRIEELKLRKQIEEELRRDEEERRRKQEEHRRRELELKQKIEREQAEKLELEERRRFEAEQRAKIEEEQKRAWMEEERRRQEFELSYMRAVELKVQEELLAKKDQIRREVEEKVRSEYLEGRPEPLNSFDDMMAPPPEIDYIIQEENSHDYLQEENPHEYPQE